MSRDWTILELDYPADPHAAFARFAGDRDAAWIDGRSPLGRPPVPDDEWDARRADFSLWCAAPLATIEQFDGAPAELRVHGRVARRGRCAWRLWREAADALPRLPAPPAPAAPGWVGFVGFEMARQLERLPESHRPDLGLPLLRLMLFNRARLLDHRRRCAVDLSAPAVEEALGRIAAPCPADAPPAKRGSESGWAPAGAPSVEAQLAPDDFERRVQAALDYIAAGDVYQVNLAQRFHVRGLPHPQTTLARLHRANPSPFAALLQWQRSAVISASPELFLSTDGDAVLTRPIKGTRPRGQGEVQDTARRDELLASAKDAAELAMIIDLHRNDLGRVCRFGSIHVPAPRAVEAHPEVWHTAADVVGRLRPGVDAIDLLRACFPAGSVTGVPKIRALQIIDELEPAARGVYTGAVGVVGLDGSMSMNVAIRTLQQHGDRATYYAGAGIVADSDPAREYEETLAKARGVLEAIAPQPATRLLRPVAVAP